MTAKGLNETEACAMLGIRRETWYAWKHDNVSVYSDIFTRIRGNRINNLLGKIELASAGGDDAMGRPVRQDWRAAHTLLAITEPARFAANGGQGQAAPVTVNVAILPELSQRIYSTATPPALAASRPAKALPERGDAIDIEAAPSQDKASQG